MPELDPVVRFSQRALYYAAGRAAYPDSVIESLRRDPGLAAHAVVADIGSGTGLSAELFLRHGHTVFAIEPNAEMRQMAEQRLAGQPHYRGIAARAEATTLPAASIDLVVCGSAFHWFRAEEVRVEFARILRPRGAVAILRNGRNAKASEFMRAYAGLFRRYAAGTAARANREGSVRDFFAGSPYRTEMLGYVERLDYETLRSRLLSYSTIPLPGDDGYEPMIAELRCIFDDAAAGGRIEFFGEVTLHAGPIAS